MHVVATAGHVDHGKSTLVRALTGSDPDRLEEEHRRGLSIELGYCWTRLEGAGEVAFVDVPGHQRFITTTLAGLGPVPVALLVVAADDPWMPQAAEHLAALDGLGVRHGLLVVTRSDLADPEPARQRARRAVAGTSLAGSPAITVSARTGEGLDDLRRGLVEVLDGVPPADPAAGVRLWVDRRFHVRGAGTVVTGTLPAGTVAPGDLLESAAGPVRVRGVEALGTARNRVSGVARVALNLAGRVPDSVERGSVLVTSGAFAPTDLVDVVIRGEGRLPRSPVLHIGSALTLVHARPLGEQHARLRLERPLPLRVGDRALLRDPGSRAVWGVRVVDPMPPPLRRRGAALERAESLSAYDGSVGWHLATRRVVRRDALERAGVPVTTLPGATVEAAGWLVDGAHATHLRGRLRALVEDQPVGGSRLSTGAVARTLDLPDPALVAALVEAPVRIVDGHLVVPAREVLPAHLLAALAEVETDLAASPFSAPDRARLRDLGLDPAGCAALARAGRVLRLEEDVLLPPGAADLAVLRLSELSQPFTVSDARRALGSTRRVVLPLLAHLDRTARTLRLPDDRRRLR